MCRTGSAAVCTCLAAEGLITVAVARGPETGQGRETEAVEPKFDAVHRVQDHPAAGTRRDQVHGQLRRAVDHPVLVAHDVHAREDKPDGIRHAVCGHLPRGTSDAPSA